MRSRVVFSVLIGAAIIITSMNARAQNSTSEQRVVNTGYVTRVDTKKMLIMVKGESSQPLAAGPALQGRGGGRAPRGAGGGRRGGARTTGAYPGSSSSASSAAGSTEKGEGKGTQYKVYITKNTVLTNGDAMIDLGSLKPGDHIVISGTPKGHDVEAESVQKDSDSHR